MSEQSRLASLRRYRILDTPREEAFDEIAQLAASICGTPSAVLRFAIMQSETRKR